MVKISHFVLFSSYLNTILQLIALNDSFFFFDSKGICLSGGGTEQANKRLMNELHERVKCKVFIGNDTLAPVFTAFKDGKTKDTI